MIIRFMGNTTDVIIKSEGVVHDYYSHLAQRPKWRLNNRMVLELHRYGNCTINHHTVH